MPSISAVLACYSVCNLLSIASIPGVPACSLIWLCHRPPAAWRHAGTTPALVPDLNCTLSDVSSCRPVVLSSASGGYGQPGQSSARPRGSAETASSWRLTRLRCFDCPEAVDTFDLLLSGCVAVPQPCATPGCRSAAAKLQGCRPGQQRQALTSEHPRPTPSYDLARRCPASPARPPRSCGGQHTH